MSLGEGRAGETSEPQPRKASLALRRVNKLLEDQSKRIAHAVHDEAGTLLAAVMERLEESERELGSACGTCFQEIRAMLGQIEQQLGDISHDLRPSALDERGLMAAIELLAERVAKRTGTAVAVEGSIEERRLPNAVEVAVYRVIQESLNNAAKYAQAKTIRVGLRLEGDLQCVIADDGVGFDIGEVMARRGARGLGLVGIRERVELLGGSVTIQSAPGRGTQVRVNLPVAGGEGAVDTRGV